MANAPKFKDYAHGGRVRRMTLLAEEFLRRFSQHVLPRGFVRLRGFGLLANCARERNLARCREALGVAGGAAGSPASAGELPAEREDATAEASDTQPRCPHCGQATLRPMARLPRPTVPELIASTYPRPPTDTS